MGSITQKGKPSDHGSISTANASNSQVSATATPGIGNFILPTVFFVCVPVTPRL
jgi:SCY1-like protein 1